MKKVYTMLFFLLNLTVSAVKADVFSAELEMANYCIDDMTVQVSQLNKKIADITVADGNTEIKKNILLHSYEHPVNIALRANEIPFFEAHCASSALDPNSYEKGKLYKVMVYLMPGGSGCWCKVNVKKN